MTFPEVALVERETVKVSVAPSVAWAGAGESATGVGGTSVMVTVLDDGLPRVRPPVGLLRLRLKVSFDSEELSKRVCTVKVFERSPTAKLRVPLVVV